MRVVGTFPWRSLGDDTLGDGAGHPVPVVLVHGLFGDSTNFATLRRHLAGHGIRRFSSFTYGPRLDYQRLSQGLRAHVVAVCRATGVSHVDVVGHSLGGLVARYLVQTGGAHLVRRLVTLGTPYFAAANPRQEHAIFGEHDILVPPPTHRMPRRMQVVGTCGHLGLLTDVRSLGAVVQHLAGSAPVGRRTAGHGSPNGARRRAIRFRNGDSSEKPAGSGSQLHAGLIAAGELCEGRELAP